MPWQDVTRSEVEWRRRPPLGRRRVEFDLATGERSTTWADSVDVLETGNEQYGRSLASADTHPLAISSAHR